MNLNRIQTLVKSKILPHLILEDLPVYESCIKRKMTKIPFTAKGYRGNECLELEHTNMCGPFNVHARGGYEYFITFTDDYSRFGYVYQMHKKSNALDKFIEFKLGKHIKVFQFD